MSRRAKLRRRDRARPACALRGCLVAPTCKPVHGGRRCQQALSALCWPRYAQDLQAPCGQLRLPCRSRPACAGVGRYSCLAPQERCMAAHRCTAQSVIASPLRAQTEAPRARGIICPTARVTSARCSGRAASCAACLRRHVLHHRRAPPGSPCRRARLVASSFLAVLAWFAQKRDTAGHGAVRTAVRCAFVRRPPHCERGRTHRPRQWPLPPKSRR